MSYKHGVYIQENPTKLDRPVTSQSAVQFIVGTAPINLLENPSEAVNQLILVNDFDEAKSKVGFSKSFDKFTICQSVDASFRLFSVTPLVIVNVLNPAVHKVAVSEELNNVLNNQIIIQEEGIMLDDDFIVKDATNTTTYVKEVDYTIAFNEAGYVLLKILTDGTIPTDATQLSLSYTQLDPSAVTNEDIIGAYDSGTDTYSGLELIEQVYPRLSVNIGLITAPGFSHKPDVGAAMISKTENISGVFKCECLLDVDTVTANLHSLVSAWKSTNEYNSSHCIVTWPMVSVDDNKYYMSALLGALIAYTDYQNDGVPYVSPSNKGFRIDGTILSDGTEVHLDMIKANLLNANGIVTAINFNGWRSWGNNTGAYPDIVDPKDRFIAIRRMFDWWSNDFIKTYFTKVDDPMNLRLIESIVDNENIKANGFKARFQLAEARMEFVQADNPTSDLVDGIIKVNQILSPYPPARTIINTIEFSPSALSTALFGGE